MVQQVGRPRQRQSLRRESRQSLDEDHRIDRRGPSIGGADGQTPRDALEVREPRQRQAGFATETEVHHVREAAERVPRHQRGDLAREVGAARCGGGDQRVDDVSGRVGDQLHGVEVLEGVTPGALRPQPAREHAVRHHHSAAVRAVAAGGVAARDAHVGTAARAPRPVALVQALDAHAGSEGQGASAVRAAVDCHPRPVIARSSGATAAATRAQPPGDRATAWEVSSSMPA